MALRLRRMVVLGAVAAVAGGVFPASALAHGIVGRADLPIPTWLFSWTASVVLVVSFVALSTLWTRPRLQRVERRRLCALPLALEPVANVVGLALFALVLYSGFAGTQLPYLNFSDTFIYVVFWVGLPVGSLLFGDVFHVFSPWRSFARALIALLSRVRGAQRGTPPLRYPRRLGVWPAIAVLLGFGWLELVYVNRDQPSVLAALSLGYFVVTVVGMVAFGVAQWSERVDGFSVYFTTLARLSALEWRGGVAFVRRPLSGVTALETPPGMVTLICTIIGTTTFDGFSNGGTWRTGIYPTLESFFSTLGANPTPASELAGSVGLLGAVALVAGVYRVGVLGVRSATTNLSTRELSATFAHTLVPIGAAYMFAHYFSLLIWQGQAIAPLASDPLGNGTNLLGTGNWTIHYNIISFTSIWYVQVAALVAGHLGGLVLAHDRALVTFRDQREAIRSQYWMLAVMVAFTSFGLWLLSAVAT